MDNVTTGVLIPLAEYLGHTYDPDCEYLEGVLLERNVGEMSHGDVQTSIALEVRLRAEGFWAVVEVRVQVKPERFRIPDVSIVRGGKPASRIFISPPEVAVEVLSRDDRVPETQSKIDDYLAFGIPCVWVIDPDTRRAWIHSIHGTREAKDGTLRNVAGDLAVSLAALFTD